MLSIQITDNFVEGQPGTFNDLFDISSYNAFSRCLNNNINCPDAVLSAFKFRHFGSRTNSTGVEIKNNYMNLYSFGGVGSVGVHIIAASGAIPSSVGGSGVYITDNVVRGCFSGNCY